MKFPATDHKGGEHYHGLALARTGLMIVVVLFHICRIFAPDGDWRVSYPDQDAAYRTIAGLFDTFQMAGFYLLAGFFFAMSSQRHGFQKAAADRLYRLIIPMLFVGFTLNILADLQLGVMARYDSFGEYLLKGGWLGHLWFIGNLFVYNLISAPASKLLERISLPRIWPIYKAVLLIISVPAFYIVCLYTAKVTYEDTLLFVSFYKLFQYMPFYFVGVFFWYYRDLFFFMIRPSIAASFYLIALILAFLSGQYFASGPVFNYVDGLYDFAITLLVIGVMNMIGERFHPKRIMDEASYTIYLLHQPLLILIFPLFLSLAAPHFVTFALMVSVTFIVTFLVHIMLVRKSRALLFLMNGLLPKRKSFPPIDLMRHFIAARQELRAYRHDWHGPQRLAFPFPR